MTVTMVRTFWNVFHPQAGEISEASFYEVYLDSWTVWSTMLVEIVPHPGNYFCTVSSWREPLGIFSSLSTDDAVSHFRLRR